MEIRFKFLRGKEVMFLSHLDLMRTFARAFRRSTIPIAYSTGYNPHVEMVFGLPLQVGVTSSSEYLDITTASEINPQDAMALLNAQMPDGLRIVGANHKQTRSNIMASITHASYEMSVMYPETADRSVFCTHLAECVQRFMDSKTCLVMKETKHTKREVNIRPLVLSLDVCGNRLVMTVFAGSADNLKPDLLLTALNDIYCKTDSSAISGEPNLSDVPGEPADSPLFQKLSLHRTALYIVSDGGVLLRPEDDKILLKT